MSTAHPARSARARLWPLVVAGVVGVAAPALAQDEAADETTSEAPASDSEPASDPASEPAPDPATPGAPATGPDSEASGATPPTTTSPELARPATYSEEIVVVGQQELARRRALLEADIRELGYRDGKRRDDRTIFRPETPWKPTVVVHDDGFITVKRSPVRFEPPLAGNAPIRYLACIPPLTILCVRLGGQLVTKARLDAQKAKVVYEVDEELDSWREGIASNAMSQRLGEDLPDALDALWESGQPLEGIGPPLATAEQRRAALLDLWATRACTPEGDVAAELVRGFVTAVVDTSSTPTTPAERSAAQASASCGRSLVRRTP